MPHIKHTYTIIYVCSPYIGTVSKYMPIYEQNISVV